MSQSIIEHVNFTVSNPESVAKTFCQLFDWHIRWSGDALEDGKTIHVGDEASYLALYSHPELETNPARDHKLVANLNHIGVLVDDLESVEQKVKAAGLKPYSHQDYQPGRRFYFLIEDDIEVEVVSYQ